MFCYTYWEKTGHEMQRFYAIHFAESLFGEHLIIREWGRIGHPGRRMMRACENEEARQNELVRLCRIRARRNYKLIIFRGGDEQTRRLILNLPAIKGELDRDGMFKCAQFEEAFRLA